MGDEATGFWKALDEVFPGARHQRYWVHKVANVLNKFPKSMQPTVKADLHEIWRAETHAAAETVMDTFAENYSAKYEQVRTSDDLPDQEPRALDRPNYGLVADLFQSVPELTEKLG